MLKIYRIALAAVIFMACGVASAYAASASAAKTPAVNEKAVAAAINALKPANYSGAVVKVNKVVVNDSRKTAEVRCNEALGHWPLTKADASRLADTISSVLPARCAGYAIDIKIDDIPIDKYCTSSGYHIVGPKEHKQFITRLDAPKAPKGLDGRNIAMWQSHGWYYEPTLNRWEWQRARLMTTVEDLYTQSYVVPFLMPMLENAGAYVMTPRERDTNAEEIIVDADGGYAQAGYHETSKGHKWEDVGVKGFAYKRLKLQTGDNPFADGTVRMAKTASDEAKAPVASWTADMPKRGSYAVYVSYATLPNSATDALYRINSLEGTTSYRVNQRMGGGTWIYLGHFTFDKGRGERPAVELVGVSDDSGSVVTADAVKIGGGMGNVLRKVEKSGEGIDYQPVESRYPRFVEGARYWLQWAGVPDSVYTPSKNVNDYTDDYKCRGIWVNYLAGGSSILPKNKGLGIPIDMSMAFHTDAGLTPDTTIVGSLGIYYSNGAGRYVNGTDRMASRDLMDRILTSICKDVRAKYEPNWTRRGLWDKSYFEARVPEVPAILLELLSHQNYADMTYGLNPSFRFTVSRAIYKGILQFLAARDKRDYVVQPLPINSFAIKEQNGGYTLSWQATDDDLEPTAVPDKYIIEERVGDGGFQRLAVTADTHYDVAVADEEIHSYRIIAANDGGVSFPSETLALCHRNNSKGTVMIVNGFTRLSAPDSFDDGKMAGFLSANDNGVPYINDILFAGAQYEYRRNLPWTDDDDPGFGASRADFETKVIAGNTFDFPAVHGRSIAAAGYSFVSSSLDAYCSSADAKYAVVDLILGKQRTTIEGRGAYGAKFQIYPAKLRSRITADTRRGVNVIVTGSYVGADLWDNPRATGDDRSFAKNVLGYAFRTGRAASKGGLEVVQSRYPQFKRECMKYVNTYGEYCYAVESPDCLYGVDEKTSAPIIRYSENNYAAAIAVDKGTYRTFISGVPFETIDGQNDRDLLMGQILDFLTARSSKSQKKK